LASKTRPAAESPRDADGSEPDARNPYEAAEEYYKRGRALYERSDLHTAAHLLREAIKLDANRSSYHYQLGLVLSTLSQARKEHKHHKGCHVTCRLGGLLARNQRVRREAERHLLKAAELDPSNPEIKLKLGLLYKDAALDQKSQQYFYEALMLDANSKLAKLELGLDRETQTAKPMERVKRRSKPRSSRR
jgi:tetratricopeptide (TPR) repeat protein